MKIKSVTKIGTRPVYDISVQDAEHYILENGVVTHNTGIYYSADQIFIIGRQQEKDGTEVTGYNFIINVEKSRFAREKSKIPVTVLHGSGISKWSGLLDIALAGKFVIKPSNGWYSRVDDDGVVEDKKFREDATNSQEFWGPVLSSSKFKQYIEDTYKVSGDMITDEEIDSELEEV